VDQPTTGGDRDANENQAGKAIWLMGGGELIREFLAQDLIDEFILSVHPVLLGDGIALFPPGFRKMELKLKQTQQFESGLLQLIYVR
jgi:dihydrofolate reductase